MDGSIYRDLLSNQYSVLTPCRDSKSGVLQTVVRRFLVSIIVSLQMFLKKLIYDPDAETILDDPSLFADYLYEAAIGGILGAVSGSVNVETNADTDAYVRTNADPGVESAVQQYIEAVQTGLEQNTDDQVEGYTSIRK